MGACASCSSPSTESVSPHSGRCLDDLLSDKRFSYYTGRHSMSDDAMWPEGENRHWSRKRVFSQTPSLESSLRVRSKKGEADADVIRKAVEQSTLLGAVLKPQLQELIDYMEESCLAEGEKCDLSGGICVILSGRLELTDAATGKVEGMYSAGDVVGDVGLLHSK